MIRKPEIPVSWGEVIDKITILEIKSKNIKQEPAASNIANELSLLVKIAEEVIRDKTVQQLKSELLRINSDLWDIEDQIRLKESELQFAQDFILLARSVYKRNDIRAKLKRDLNEHLRSELVEEKSYRQY